jgi:hypothetical protein
VPRNLAVVDEHDTKVTRDEVKQWWRFTLDGLIEEVLAGHEWLQIWKECSYVE